MIAKCEYGHWYDKDVHRVCPHCKRNSEKLNMRIEDDIVEDDRTVAFAKESISLGEELGAIIGNSVSSSEAFGGNPINFSADGDDKTVSFGFFGVMDIRPVTGWLVCVDGSEKGKDFRLCSGKNFIGRSTTMDVILTDDKKITREKHCNISYDCKGNCFYLSPEGGNLTYLNGQLLVKSKALEEGDIITLGETNLVFIPYCKGERVWKEDAE